MRLFRAEPARTLSFAPGRDRTIISSGSGQRSEDAGAALRSNLDVSRAPIDRFDVRFLETMRGKGWLKDKWGEKHHE